MQNLKGKTALVTGATSGIGLECAIKLAAAGARTVLVGRNAAKTEACVAQVRQRSRNGDVSFLLCDFSVQAQVRTLAADYLAKYDRLDIMVNNAGAVNDRRTLTADGLEATFAVNHLGYFLLTNLLLDLIKKSTPARIVNVSSRGHYRGDMPFDNLQYEKGGYWIMGAYCRSKLANVLFTAELSRRLAGTNVTATSLHPGAVATEIWSGAPWFVRPILNFAKRFMLTTEEGGNRIAHLAMSPEVEGQTGGYYDKYQLKTPSALARDEGLARKLWDVSAQLVKL